MTRYGTAIEDGTVYVEADVGRIEVGDLETILELVGGPAWTIEYDDWEKRRYDIDTADEGLTVDVVDTIHAMTFGEEFVATLSAQPVAVQAGDAEAGGAAPQSGDRAPGPPAGAGPAEDAAATGDASPVSPRLGLFVGRLLENLEYGVR